MHRVGRPSPWQNGSCAPHTQTKRKWNQSGAMRHRSTLEKRQQNDTAILEVRVAGANCPSTMQRMAALNPDQAPRSGKRWGPRRKPGGLHRMTSECEAEGLDYLRAR